MQTHYAHGIPFKFRRPNSMPKRQPSEEMRKALRSLAESDEVKMKSFIATARARHRNVVLEVFHANDGRPLLIHAASPRNHV